MPQPLHLNGCTPEPPMGYIKALGVFRIIAEQKDPECRACWEGGQFVLHTKLADRDLIHFFTEKYEPSPNFSPWNGDGGFLTESGTSHSTIQTIRQSQNPRLKLLQSSSPNPFPVPSPSATRLTSGLGCLFPNVAQAASLSFNLTPRNRLQPVLLYEP